MQNNFRLTPKAWLFQRAGIATLLMALFGLSGCQTLMGPSAEDQKQADIMRTQKSLVISFLNKGLPGFALKELKRHLKSYPKDPDFKNLMGLTLLALKNPQKSIKYFKSAKAIDNKISFSLNLGSAYIEAQQFRKAITQLKKTKRHPEYEEYRFPERVSHNLGLASEKLGRLQDAQKYYRTALKSNPNFYISLMRMAQIYENKKRPKLARKYFIRAQKACVVCFDPVNGIASTYIAQGNAKKAVAILSKFSRQKSASKEDKKKARDLMRVAGKSLRQNKRRY